MIEKTLLSTALLFAFDVSARCTLDAPEIGDSGPSSEVVCREFEKRYPGSTISVDDRFIHSSEIVTVRASVDREPIAMKYELTGFAWRPAQAGGAQDRSVIPEGLSMR